MRILYKDALWATRNTRKTAWMDIEWGRPHKTGCGMLTEKTGRVRFCIRKTKIVSDVSDIVEQLTVMQQTWRSNGIRQVVLCLSNTLLSQNEDTVRHVVHAILGGVFVTDGAPMDIVVTNTAGNAAPLIRNIAMVENMICEARLLSTKPGNIATPAFMCKTLGRWFEKQTGVAIHKLSLRNLRSNKLNLITAVGASSIRPPCMIVVERKATAKSAQTVCIIGKGITFDTGGLALKPLESMKDMKYDKVGAIYTASVLRHICENKLWPDTNFVGVFPFAENAIGNSAMRPGDVIKSHSGKTVEITDTDAEGRLLLADAFSYAAQYKPDVLIDMATLTEHADFINCFHKGYFFVSPGGLRSKVEHMTEAIGERMLAMPSWADFDHVLDSKVADLKNSPSECSDSYTAALFLKQFVPETVKTWLHIDIAHDVKDEMPNGYGMRSVLRFLEIVL